MKMYDDEFNTYLVESETTRDYLSELDEEFVINFVKEFLNDSNNYTLVKININEKAYIAQKEDNAWKVVAKKEGAINTRYTFFLGAFHTLYQGLTSKSLNLKWRTALCKKFGKEYYTELKDELTKRHFQKVNNLTEKLKSDLETVKTLGNIIENTK